MITEFSSKQRRPGQTALRGGDGCARRSIPVGTLLLLPFQKDCTLNFGNVFCWSTRLHTIRKRSSLAALSYLFRVKYQCDSSRRGLLGICETAGRRNSARELHNKRLISAAQVRLDRSANGGRPWLIPTRVAFTGNLMVLMLGSSRRSGFDEVAHSASSGGYCWEGALQYGD
jgi:hypothetical protein